MKNYNPKIDCAYRESHTRPGPATQTDEGRAHSSLKRQEAREISERDWRTEKKFVAVLAASIGTNLSVPLVNSELEEKHGVPLRKV